MKNLIVTFVCLLMAAAAFAQQPGKPLVQFTGVVHNVDTLDAVIPYATITNITQNKQVAAANYKGYFSFVAHEEDSLRFTCIGFIPKTIVIPKGVNKSYTLQVAMKAAVTNLPTVRVFPWATSDEFRKDFLALKVADDDLEIARKNLNKGSLAEMAKTLPRDANEIQSTFAQQEHLNILNSHSLMPNPLLNPIAWGSLIKEISEGDKSRSGSGN